MQNQIQGHSGNIPNLNWKQDHKSLTLLNQEQRTALYDTEKADIFGRCFSSVFTSEPDTDEMPFLNKLSFEDELNNINKTKAIV